MALPGEPFSAAEPLILPADVLEVCLTPCLSFKEKQDKLEEVGCCSKGGSWRPSLWYTLWLCWSLRLKCVMNQLALGSHSDLNGLCLDKGRLAAEVGVGYDLEENEAICMCLHALPEPYLLSQAFWDLGCRLCIL